MKLKYGLGTACIVTSLAIFGCNRGANDTGGEEHAGETAHDEHAGHEHEHGDELWWQRENLELADCTLSLGHHGIHPHAGEPLEAAVVITRGEDPVEDAQVFVCLVDDGGEMIGEEEAAVFEPASGEEAAHYAGASVDVPAAAEEISLRYRIELADGTSESYDVPVKVVHHEHEHE